MFKTFQIKLRNLFLGGERRRNSSMEKHCQQESDYVEHLLEQPQPLPKVPDEVHNAILRAVRKSACEPGICRMGAWSDFFKPQAVAFALAVLLLAGGSWWTVDSRTMRHSAALTSQMSETFAFIDGFGTNAPMLLARPIEAQFSELTNDFNRTTEIVLASLP